MNEPKYGYMCQTDWDWELGEALGGSTIYPSVEDLKDHRKCVSSCGIVKVKIELEEIVDKGKGWSSEDSEET
jgi:hypothetical protein